MRRFNFLLIFGIIQSAIWGSCLMISPEVLNITSMALIKSTGMSAVASGIIILASASLGFISIWGTGLRGSVRFLLLTPQTILFFMASVGALRCIIAGHFADGVIRSIPFLIADQMTYVIVAILHLTAVMKYSLVKSEECGGCGT